MKGNRVWIEIVILGMAVACFLALLIASLGTAVGAAEDQDVRAFQLPVGKTEQVYEGMVTCSRCGAQHSAKIAQTASTCVRVCVHDGAQFALVDSETTYVLDGDPAKLKEFAGQRARIVGYLIGRTIKVSSAAAA